MKQVSIEIEGALYLYLLTQPTMTGRKIYGFWYRSNVFKEYDRPEAEAIVEAVERIKKEIGEQLQARQNQYATP